MHSDSAHRLTFPHRNRQKSPFNVISRGKKSSPVWSAGEARFPMLGAFLPFLKGHPLWHRVYLFQRRAASRVLASASVSTGEHAPRDCGQHRHLRTAAHREPPISHPHRAWRLGGSSSLHSARLTERSLLLASCHPTPALYGASPVFARPSSSCECGAIWISRAPWPTLASHSLCTSSVGPRG